MGETYETEHFSFESRESYEQAKKEKEIIEQLIQNVDLSDPKKALKVYHKAISEKVFCTVTGYFFLVELRQSILDSGIVTERALAPIPVKEPAHRKRDIIPEPSGKEERYRRLYEGQMLMNKKWKIALAAAILVLIGFVVINFRFEYSIFTYFTNYKANMEEELIDKYEAWEEKLEEREKQLEQ